MFIDTHCHLDFTQFDMDREEVIQRAKEQGIDYIINIGSSILGSRRSLELSKEYDFIYATIGIHPHEADNFNQKLIKELEDLARDPKVVAVGEIGLDYFKNYSSIEKQKELFISLIDLAKELDLPLVIHCRNSQKDILEILRQKDIKKAVVHCFSGDAEFLNSCLDLGFFISFTCNITYKNAYNLQALVKKTPLDRLMLETDAPFLPPDPFRGKRNEPVYIKLLAEKIAELKDTSIEEVGGMTTENAKRFFNLK